MKKTIFISAIAAIIVSIAACDKVDNAYPIVVGSIDTNCYPGNFADYQFPTFTANANTDRNTLLEDLTGHQCIFCPAAADLAHQLEGDNPGRVFISTIHSGPTGKENFQATTPEPYTYDFTNAVGIEIGTYFGGSNVGFNGNPSGTVGRVEYSGKVCMSPNQWTNALDDLLSENKLTVNLQAVVNYFPETHACFIHSEVDVVDETLDPANIGLVVAFYQDSIIKPQKNANNETVYDYVHRDLLIAHVNGVVGDQMVGEALSPANLEGGKYYYNHSYKIDESITSDNAHFLVYVVDIATREVLQVIKKKLL